MCRFVVDLPAPLFRDFIKLLESNGNVIAALTALNILNEHLATLQINCTHGEVMGVVNAAYRLAPSSDDAAQIQNLLNSTAIEGMYFTEPIYFRSNSYQET